MRKTTPPAVAPSPLDVITTGTGYFKPGFSGRIVGGAERLVLLGPHGAEVPHTIPEFTLEIAGRRREFCQFGRDFVFATPAANPECAQL